jgi:hypothetical protein
MWEKHVDAQETIMRQSWCMLILGVFSNLTTFRVLLQHPYNSSSSLYGLYRYSHRATHLFPKASRPRSIIIVLTIYPTLVSKRVLLLKCWYSWLIDFFEVVIALITTVAEPPRLFQLKCPSLALEATTHLNRNNWQFLGSSPIKPLTKNRITLAHSKVRHREIQ